MALSTAELEAVVRDLAPKLQGGRIERIDQPERHKLILTVRKDSSRYWLLVCADPRFSRMHLLTSRPEQGRPAAGFCNLVRQHMTGAPIKAIRQAPEDRIVFVECVERDRLMRPHKVSLVAELIGVGSNLLVLDESDSILGTLVRGRSARRDVSAGARYRPLETLASLPDKARVNRFEDALGSEDPLALSRAIQVHYARLEAAQELEGRRSELRGALRSALKSRRRRLHKVSEDLHRAENAECIRRQGELLKIALPDIVPGQREVVVEDIFEPGNPPLTIELNPTLPARENIEWLFGRYKKAKAGRDRLAARADQTRREIEALEELRSPIEEADALEVLAELKEKAQETGVPLPDKRPRPARQKETRGPRAFRSAGGLEILVSRSRAENERLTFSIARGNDHWMHLLGWPGPHVVIRRPGGQAVSQEDLLDAAHLAVHFSKIRGAQHAEVTHTQCKNVRRMKGAATGTVSYADATNMRIRIEPERLERLLRKRSDINGGGKP